MGRLSKRYKESETPKSLLPPLLFVVGTIAAVLMFFPPWGSQEERTQKMTEKIMKRVEEAEKGQITMLVRKYAIKDNKLKIKVITDKITKTDKDIKLLVKDVFTLVDNIDIANKDGEIYKINQAAGAKAVITSDELYQVLKWCQQFSKQVDGYFDVGMLPYYELWNFDHLKPRIADPQVIEGRVDLVGISKVIFDDNKKTVFLPVKGMGLDLRAIIKGLVLRKIKERFTSLELKDYFVFFGSDAIMSGSNFDNPWKISIPHPRKALHHYAIFKPGDNAIMVANDYEKGFVRKGFRYHAFLEPHSGRPIQKTNAIAIIGQDPLIADALSFALFIQGEDGLKMFDNITGYHAVIMTVKEEVKFTKQMKEYLVEGEGKDF